MSKEKQDLFDGSDVEFAIDVPPFLKDTLLGKLMDSLIQRSMNFMNYIQAPMLKMFKYFGGPIGRLLGLGTPKYDVVRLKEHLLTMHDGAKLATDIYLPKPVFEDRFKAPTMLIRLPYWKDIASMLGYIFASKGYVTILQDMRGCAASSEYGTLAITFYLRSDGLETLKWITERFWYNGKIGMWGISFLGITQLAVSWDNKGMLTCASPAQNSYTSVLYHPQGMNVLGMGVTIHRLVKMITQRYLSIKGFSQDEQLCETLYRNPLASLYNDPLDTKRFLLHLEDLEKITDEEELTNLINETYNLNFKFNEKDDGSLDKFMKGVMLKRRVNSNYNYLPYAFRFTGEKIETPMLIVGSWYDMFIEQFLTDLKLIQKNSPEHFKNFKMVVGPGAHGGMDFMASDSKFPSMPDTKEMFALYQNFFPLWWYEYWLKKGGKDLSKVPTLRLYILNRKIWRHFSKWPPNCKELKLYLHSNGKANSRFGRGGLSGIEPKDEPPDSFDFDPSNPVVTRGGRFLFIRSGPLNQIKIEERKDVLVYTTDKLRQGLEVIGDVKIVFYASSSAKDTDFTVKLVDVYNDKKAINVVDNGVRARFRDGLKNPSLLEPNKVYKYEIPIGAVGIYFPKDHKIRIEISSSNFPRFDVNSNLAGEPNEKGYITANQKIFHDSEYPSHLILPVFKRY
ncbi:MAG: CocE/NonD family hydrolase [Candidatus Helarchaeota archaeon]|nr:CocE/NonD family hydrolase [Candidatus Helarchaeota archaeon]